MKKKKGKKRSSAACKIRLRTSKRDDEERKGRRKTREGDSNRINSNTVYVKTNL